LDRAVDLAHPDRVSIVQYLPMQVADLDLIAIHQTYSANPSTSKIHARRAA
jgi:hypothetical protein